MSEYIKIKFKDGKYDFDLYFSTLNGPKLENGGCIELQPAMSNCGYSWAYLEHGNIMQFGEVIGTINDIEIINDEELSTKEDM